MKNIDNLSIPSVVGFLILTYFGTCNAQTPPSAPPTLSPAGAALLLRFQLSQQQINQQLQLNGVGAGRLNNWIRNNPNLILATQTLAVQLGALSSSQPLPMVTNVVIPADASGDLEDFLTAQANLWNLRAQIHNELLQQGTLSPQAEENAFAAAGQTMLQQQQQRSQRLGDASDQQAITLPPPLVIPANASPTLQALLSLRDQLMRGEMTVHNQNLQVDSATRAAAVQAWREANASQFQQLQQLAQNLAQGN